MKKLFLFLLAFLMMAVLAEGASAEEPVTLNPLVDWTQIVTDIMTWGVRILSGILLALFSYIGKKYMAPWVKENRLTGLVYELVRAAEARFGRNQGETKLRQVFDWLRAKGINADDDAVIQAVMAAWQDLDFEMISLGLKEPPNEMPEIE